MKLTDNKKARSLENKGLIDVNTKEVINMNSLNQNTAKPNTQPLVIGNFSIRQDEDGRYCINDLHKASGGADKHQPAFFMRNKQTKDLIEELESEIMICKNADHKMQVVNTIKGKGLNQGTFVVKELVYYYAMWISAKFHLTVIRAYDAMVMGQFNQQPLLSKTTKQDRVPLKDAVNMLVGKAQFLNYSDAYKLVHQRFGVEHIEDIPHEDIPKAVEYVHHLMGEYIPKAEIIESETEIKNLQLLEADTTNKVMDYYGALHAEIKRLKGKIPDYPKFDKETIVKAVVTRMVQGCRMLLTVDHQTSKPSISFIPSQSWIVTDQNIASIVGDPCGVKREVLPDIVQKAVKRLSK